MLPTGVASLRVNAEHRKKELKMLNNVVIIGRLQEIKEGGILVLATPSSFKNDDGEYETYINEFQLMGGILDNTKKYCKKGDLIGVKGTLRNNIVIAEKITFLSNNKEN